MFIKCLDCEDLADYVQDTPELAPQAEKVKEIVKNKGFEANTLEEYFNTVDLLRELADGQLHHYNGGRTLVYE